MKKAEVYIVEDGFYFFTKSEAENYEGLKDELKKLDFEYSPKEKSFTFYDSYWKKGIDVYLNQKIVSTCYEANYDSDFDEPNFEYNFNKDIETLTAYPKDKDETLSLVKYLIKRIP